MEKASCCCDLEVSLPSCPCACSHSQEFKACSGCFWWNEKHLQTGRGPVLGRWPLLISKLSNQDFFCSIFQAHNLKSTLGAERCAKMCTNLPTLVLAGDACLPQRALQLLNSMLPNKTVKCSALWIANRFLDWNTSPALTHAWLGNNDKYNGMTCAMHCLSLLKTHFMKPLNWIRLELPVSSNQIELHRF